ncbi:hypothetical protein EV128_10556 [Rhizobium azibense]|nr:hypothetical protein EV128_10556 [Rhizobium azibense]
MGTAQSKELHELRGISAANHPRNCGSKIHKFNVIALGWSVLLAPAMIAGSLQAGGLGRQGFKREGNEKLPSRKRSGGFCRETRK